MSYTSMMWFTKAVLLCVVAQCLSMSFDELQDFSNFLNEKSLLDQPLKKNPADESDDVDPISDHAWEESGRFEGDLILNDRQRQLIVQDVAEGLSRNGLKDSTKRWPDNEVVFYIQKEHFNSDQVQAILSGIDDLSRASCVKFRPYRKGDRDAVVVQGIRRGCFSQVGYQGGYQVLNLSGRHPVGRGCFRHGTIVHEFLHTLGFYHMQSSPDRDDYVDVVWENIVQPARHNFRKYNLFSVSDFGVGYDYDSVLHYSRKAFSSNGGDTLVPKTSGAEIGQRVGLSDKDTAKLNKMYCDADANNPEAEEAEPNKTVNKKKKKSNNKPFQGHGIGYHQGKTVVIKLPAAETYRLPDTPSYHVFDYFSKTPQAMPPKLIEGLGIGKKITYSYTLPTVFRPYQRNVPVYLNHGFSSTPSSAIDHIPKQENDKSNNVEIKYLSAIIGNNKSKETIEDLDKKEEVEKPLEVNSGFYMPDTDYSKFYDPSSAHPPVTTKTDLYLNYSPSLKGSIEDTPQQITNLKLTRQFIETLHEPKSINHFKDKFKKRESLDDDKHETKRETDLESEPQSNEKRRLGEVDISFGKIYPRQMLEEIRGIYSIKPKYTSFKHLENKQDYSSYYNPYEKKDKAPQKKNSPYTLFGETVPFTGSWRQKDDAKQTPNRHSFMRDDEIISKQVAHTPQSASLENLENNRSNENVGSDYIESDDSIEKQNPQYNAKDGNPASSYEAIENVEIKGRTATEKSNIDDTDNPNERYSLEDRLSKILESYMNFDDYDISSLNVSPRSNAADDKYDEGSGSDSSAEYDRG